ncbi:MAG: transglutaminase domain-containing protein, partial [Candidatus Limnocylindrales bacterium]
ANIALTSRPQLPYLVAYTATALFLLIEMHAFDERATWLRRRIGDPATISSLYLRGGTVFIALALLGSMVLTTRAASSPLAGAWDGVDEQLIAIGEQLGRYLPNGGDLRPVGGVTFGSTFKIRDTWTTDPGIAFTATVPATEEKLYWRAATYDQFLLEGWDQTQTSKQAVDAGQSLLANTPEAAVESQTRPVTVTVRPDEYRDRAMLVPGIPVTADRSVQVILTGTRGWFGGIELSSARDGYTVQARVLQMGKGQDQITENRLRNAGTVYPAEITALYTGVPDGAIGPDATELLQAIISEAGTTEPYTLAKTMETYLRDPTHFFYTPDVSGIDCPSDSVVECFARFQRGYCLHYASTMAILLRAANPDHPIPTRLVQGFLPGQRSGNTETVENRSAHAWVEVFFPGYGWIRFDPTGGGIGTPTEIVEGPSIAPASPSPSGSGGPDLPDPTRRNNGDTGDPATATPPSSRGPGDRTLLILLSVLLALVVGAVAFAAWLRGPRGEVSPDVAWGSMSKAASRFGFGPRPTQTVYEYATTLGDLVPVARADLQTVAEAKVETTYAGVRIGGARLDSVRTATRRLRITLLRLLLRRPRRGSRR